MDQFVATFRRLAAPELRFDEIQKVSIPTANWVIPSRLLSGPMPRTEKDLDNLRKEGIDTIVCLQSEVVPLASHDLETLHFPVDDGCTPTKGRFIEDMTQLLKRWIDGRRIYIHCYGGHGRTGLYVCALMACLYPQMRHYESVTYYFQCVHNMRKEQKNHFYGILPARIMDQPGQRKFFTDFLTLLEWV